MRQIQILRPLLLTSVCTIVLALPFSYYSMGQLHLCMFLVGNIHHIKKLELLACPEQNKKKVLKTPPVLQYTSRLCSECSG